MSLKLSTKARYSIRAVAKLANQYGQGPIPIKAIADEENIPMRYLEQLLTQLRRAGLLESNRGPGGGYKLIKPPDQISLGEIIRVLEGQVSLSECVTHSKMSYCNQNGKCIVNPLWKNLSRMIQQFLDNVTFQELLNGNWKGKELTMSFEKEYAA